MQKGKSITCIVKVPGLIYSGICIQMTQAVSDIDTRCKLVQYRKYAVCMYYEMALCVYCLYVYLPVCLKKHDFCALSLLTSHD